MSNALELRKPERPVRPAVWLPLLASLAFGCGPQARSAPAPAPVPVAGAEGSTPTEPTDEPAEVQGGSWYGLLHVQDGVATVTVTGGHHTEDPGSPAPEVGCVEAARADITPHDGDEVVWQCMERGEPSATFAVALTSGNRLLWTQAELHPSSCIPLAPMTVQPVDAVPDSPPELLLRVVACDFTGEMIDLDSLWKWGEGEMRSIADAHLDCQYMGDTSDPEDEPPEDAAWLCTGGYLELDAEAAPRVVETAQQIYTRDDRDGASRMRFGDRREGDRGAEPVQPGDIVRRTLRWDPEAFRLVGE